MSINDAIPQDSDELTEKAFKEAEIYAKNLAQDHAEKLPVSTHSDLGAFTAPEVEHPSHYTTGKVECIDAIHESMSDVAFKGYLKGNIQKYMWRYEKKGTPLVDLQKAQVYLGWLIEEES